MHMVQAKTSTGKKAQILRICPPKGSLLEPLCNLLDSPLPSFDFEPGDIKFFEGWEEQLLGPSNVFDETWSFSPLAPGTPQFIEPWELMVFVLGPLNFLEPWNAPSFIPVPVFDEPWNEQAFIPGSLQFLEEWEDAPSHTWGEAGDFLANGSQQHKSYSFANWTGPNASFMATVGGGSPGGFVYRDINDGNGFENSNKIFGNPGQGSNITQTAGLVEFSGAMYFSAFEFGDTYLEIWRSTTGLIGSWAVDNTFLTGNDNAARGVAVFGGNLYYGTRNATGSGAQILKRTPGGVWTTEHTFAVDEEEISKLYVFGGQLYASFVASPVGTGTDGDKLYRSVDGTNWVLAHTFTGVDGVYDLVEYGGLLYASVFNTGVSLEVWSSANGTTWNLSNSFSIDDVDDITGAMATDGATLFVGLGNVGGASSKRPEVYTFDGITWTLSVDFETEGIGTDVATSVTGMGFNSINSKIYAGVGDESSFPLGSINIFLCPDTGGGGGGGGG